MQGDKDLSYLSAQLIEEINKAYPKNKRIDNFNYSTLYDENRELHDLYTEIENIILDGYVPSESEVNFFGSRTSYEGTKKNSYKNMEEAVSSVLFGLLVSTILSGLLNIHHKMDKIMHNLDISKLSRRMSKWNVDLEKAIKYVELYELLEEKYQEFIDDINQRTNDAHESNYLDVKFYVPELIYIKHILPFKSLKTNECIKKVEAFNKSNTRLVPESHTGEGFYLHPKQWCDSKKSAGQPKVGSRSFQVAHKFEKEGRRGSYDDKHGIENMYCSVDHNRRMTLMSTNFSTTFADYHCSSVNIYVPSNESGQHGKVGKYKNIDDISILENGEYYKVNVNKHFWKNDYPCFSEFHYKNKPLFIKIGVPGHTFCAFVFRDIKRVEIWDTGTQMDDTNMIAAELFKTLKGYDIFIVHTQVQGRLRKNYKDVAGEKKWTDTYCQTWIYLLAYLRLVLHYTADEIIMYILSLKYHQRMHVIDEFQTNLANNPESLKYLDIVIDMKNKGWKKRFGIIEENVKHIFDYEKDVEDDSDDYIPDNWEEKYESIMNNLENIFNIISAGRATKRPLRTTKNDFENFFYVKYTDELEKEYNKEYNKKQLVQKDYKYLDSAWLISEFFKSPQEDEEESMKGGYRECKECRKCMKKKKNRKSHWVRKLYI